MQRAAGEEMHGRLVMRRESRAARRLRECRADVGIAVAMQLHNGVRHTGDKVERMSLKIQHAATGVGTLRC